jgi:hypothetical protein
MIVSVLATLIAVAGPLAICALAARTRASIRPDWTAVALAGAMATLGLGTLGALATLAWPLAARLGFVASYGAWSAGMVEHLAPVPMPVSLAAFVGGVAMVARAVRVVSREVRVVRRSPPGSEVEELTVVEDPTPFAHAVYGWRVRPDRLVVSRGLLDTLDEQERAAVLAHERSHLRNHHAVLSLSAEMAIALNPLLARCRAGLDFSLERWADEVAAAATDRSTVAHAVGRTALAQMQTLRGSAPRPRMGLDGSSVPARVDALLFPPPDHRWRHGAAYGSLMATSAVLVLVGLAHAESIVDVLQRGG